MKTINIQRKVSKTSSIKKVFYITWAVIMWIVSFCLLFTIIGIPFAILMWIGSMGIFAAAFDKYQVDCPHCKKKNIIGEKQEDFTCKRCSEISLINWENRLNSKIKMQG